jgi:serine phosphatase RsbU (regulator of sigma subunit)
LYDATNEKAYASAALLQVAQAVASSSDLNEVLGTIIRILPILVGVRRAILYRWEESKEAFLATHQYGLDEDEQKVFTEREMTAGDFPALAYTHERNLMVAFAVQADRPVQAWLAIDPTLDVSMNPIDPDQILMSIPLSIKNDFYGILLVEEADRAGRFRPRRIEILNGIAQQTALAIQNDLLQQELVERERLETEIHLARQIQQTFIPQVLPSHASWQLAACWRTARQVGGDFYDVIELPDGRLGIFIADVADKGIPAALFMALTRTLVRAAILESSSPEDVLRRVNEQLLPDAQQGMFVTAVYGVLDLERGSFAFVNAGHNPPFWVKADSGIEKLTRTGIALGVVERAELKQRQIGMQPGDVLLLYTDGLTEAFSPDGEPFGETRLVEILSSVRSGTAQEMLDRIEESLNYFTDPNPRSDDLTMVAIKRI